MDVQTIWVCIDCLFTLANDEDHPREADFDRGMDGMDVTLGLMAEEHNEDCPNVDHDTGKWLGVGDCTGCETQDFSWSPCKICNSSLGGSRHAATAWLLTGV